MKNTLLVIGGWAVDTSVLEPVFGKRAIYIDINRLMPSLISDGRLISDWQNKLMNLLSLDQSQRITLAGWSTGAIAATAIASLIKSSKLVLLSSTPSFCRRDNFRYAMPPLVLQNMIKSIKVNKIQVLQQFYNQCGFTDLTIDYNRYSGEELVCGLQFLEQVNLIPMSTLPAPCFPVYCLHGTEDRIIPAAAGKYLCRMIGGNWIQLNGSHVFFAEKSCKIENIIASIFPERNNSDVTV